MARRKPKPRRIELTEADRREFLHIVRDDLRFLQRQDYRAPSRTDVRIASSILRRLLGDGLLEGAWRLAGFHGEPSINAIDLAASLDGIDSRYIHYAYAGGAETAGAHHLGYKLLVIPRDEAGAIEGDEERMRKLAAAGQRITKRDFTLSAFCTSPAVVSGSASVSRLGVVRYVANKLGGVHWDNTRGAWQDPVGGRHRLLDEAHVIVGRLPGPMYEVISIAEAIAKANDVERLLEVIDREAPEEPFSANVIRFREGRTGKYTDMTFPESQ